MNQTNRVECIIPQHVKPWKAGVNVENISLECSEDEDKDEKGDLAEMKMIERTLEDREAEGKCKRL
jgi:hypothetical protein